MFGNQNNQQQTQDDNHIPEQSIDGVVNSGEQADQPSGAPATSPSGADSWQHPGVPLPDTTASPITPAYPVDTPTPAHSDPAAVSAVPATAPPAPISPAPSVAVDTNDLIDIKQQALSQLSPLVGHLDQTPEEKFRTTMMMIQASDDQSKVKDAYEAAQQITDEKVRAQALLDIINEINYFTQHHHAPEAAEA